MAQLPRSKVDAMPIAGNASTAVKLDIAHRIATIPDFGNWIAQKFVFEEISMVNSNKEGGSRKEGKTVLSITVDEGV
jgi:hypothetical protein